MNPDSEKDFAKYISEKSLDELFSILSTIDKNSYVHRYELVKARIQEIKKNRDLPDDYLPRTQISSETTGLDLIVVAIPTVFIGTIVFWGMINHGFSLEAFGLIAFFLGLNVAFYYYDGTFQKVEIDNEYVYVTGRKKFAQISRNKIASVIENYALRSPRVYITFSEDTPFGNEVKFVPKSGGLYFFEFKPHQLVEHLSNESRKRNKHRG